MLMLALLACQAASAGSLGSPEWPTEWGRVRVQTYLIGDKRPDEMNLKWRSQALRVDLAAHNQLGVWVTARRTLGAGRQGQQIGGYALNGGLRTSAWLWGPFGLGFQGMAEAGEDWITGNAGGIMTRERLLDLEGSPVFLLGNSHAHAWISAALGIENRLDLLSADRTSEWGRFGYQGWKVGASLRSDNLNGLGSTRTLRSFLGLEISRTEAALSTAIWTGIGF